MPHGRGLAFRAPPRCSRRFPGCSCSFLVLPVPFTALFARMAVYCFYLFDRSGRLLCYREWCRARRTHAGEDDAKSMFGLLFALRNFCSKLSPSPLYVSGC